MQIPRPRSTAKSILPAVLLALFAIGAESGHPRVASAASAGASELPADFDVPRPAGKKWRPAPALPPVGYVNAFYGGCKSPQPCGSLVQIAAFRSGRMSLRVFLTADGKPPVAPRDRTGAAAMTPGPAGAAPIYELERDGVLLAWATIPPFVLEAEGPTDKRAQERTLRRTFRAWVDRVDEKSPTDDRLAARAKAAAAVAAAADAADAADAHPRQ